jgi:hypothetical protein
LEQCNFVRGVLKKQEKWTTVPPKPMGISAILAVIGIVINLNPKKDSTLAPKPTAKL